MRTLGLVIKGIWYVLLIGICAPFLWWLTDDAFEGETFAEYDDDDAGVDVDDES